MCGDRYPENVCWNIQLNCIWINVLALLSSSLVLMHYQTLCLKEFTCLNQIKKSLFDLRSPLTTPDVQLFRGDHDLKHLGTQNKKFFNFIPLPDILTVYTTLANNIGRRNFANQFTFLLRVVCKNSHASAWPVVVEPTS